ncbi:MAG TPA: hypothetical protein VNX68_15895 [Nitrosopumilaceae archaeon]|nr:hypothetical protein [Nitrosopumilaceae archaeon]
MEHIFDNRHILQSFVVQGGCKASAPSLSKKYLISFEEARQFFLKNLSESEFQKIKEYLHPKTKNEINHDEIILWCAEVMENTLMSHRSITANVNSRVSLRELFMERIAVSGSAYAIIFLKKHFYQENKCKELLNNAGNILYKAA